MMTCMDDMSVWKAIINIQYKDNRMGKNCNQTFLHLKHAMEIHAFLPPVNLL